MKLIGFCCILFWSSVAFSGSVEPDSAIDAHNKWRNMLNRGELNAQPVPNPFIPDVYWDNSLADSAQLHTDKCVWGHSESEDRDGAGENIYAHTPGFGSMAEGIDLWAEEYTNYSYETNEQIDTGGVVVGHYTQVVWNDSLRVGCAKSECTPLRNPDGSTMWDGTYYACRYQTPGNWIGQKPYGTSGSPAAAVDYMVNNENLRLQLVNIGGLVFRIKMTFKTYTPLVFEALAFEQVFGINLAQYPDMAYFEGNSIIIPKLTIDGVGSFNLKLKYIGGLNFELVDIGQN